MFLYLDEGKVVINFDEMLELYGEKIAKEMERLQTELKVALDQEYEAEFAIYEKKVLSREKFLKEENNKLKLLFEDEINLKEDRKKREFSVLKDKINQLENIINEKNNEVMGLRDSNKILNNKTINPINKFKEFQLKNIREKSINDGISRDKKAFQLI